MDNFYLYLYLNNNFKPITLNGKTLNSFGGATAKIVLPVEPSFQGIQGATNIRECLSEQKQGRCHLAKFVSSCFAAKVDYCCS